MMKTSFIAMCNILGELWIEYKNDTEFEDFIQYNDLGLPLAYAISAEIVTPTDKAKLFVEETFTLLLAALNLEDDEYDSLDDLIGLGGVTDE